MSKTTHKFPPKPRTTLAMRGTTSSPEVRLDFPSQLAIEYARQRLKGELGADPLASGVARRALALYMEHLAGPGLDPVQEARAVKSACSTSTVDPEDRQAALKRLDAHQQGQSFPAFQDVLHGPHRAAQRAAFEDRVEALIQEIERNRRPRKTST
jgi:hypothetical protein